MYSYKWLKVLIDHSNADSWGEDDFSKEII